MASTPLCVRVGRTHVAQLLAKQKSQEEERAELLDAFQAKSERRRRRRRACPPRG